MTPATPGASGLSSAMNRFQSKVKLLRDLVAQPATAMATRKHPASSRAGRILRTRSAFIVVVASWLGVRGSDGAVLHVVLREDLQIGSVVHHRLKRGLHTGDELCLARILADRNALGDRCEVQGRQLKLVRLLLDVVCGDRKVGEVSGDLAGLEGQQRVAVLGEGLDVDLALASCGALGVQAVGGLVAARAVEVIVLTRAALDSHGLAAEVHARLDAVRVALGDIEALAGL